MLKDELNAKKEQYRTLEEEHKRYMNSDVVRQQIAEDAERIWKRVKEILRAMPPSENYSIFVGYENNTIAYYNPDLNTVYWTEDRYTIHKMFIFKSKLRYPEDTMEAIRKLAEFEGIKCRYDFIRSCRFLVYKALFGLVFEG